MRDREHYHVPQSVCTKVRIPGAPNPAVARVDEILLSSDAVAGIVAANETGRGSVD
jgi:hypothetical protein